VGTEQPNLRIADELVNPRQPVIEYLFVGTHLLPPSICPREPRPQHLVVPPERMAQQK